MSNNYNRPDSQVVPLPDVDHGDSLPPPYLLASDPDFLRLSENVRRPRRTPPIAPRTVDTAWDVYKKVREESLDCCRHFFQKLSEWPKYTVTRLGRTMNVSSNLEHSEVDCPLEHFPAPLCSIS
jgi:hypothetical protein